MNENRIPSKGLVQATHLVYALHAVSLVLGAFGAEVEAAEDSLRITPGRLHGATVSSYGDHRMATAAAVIGLVVPGVRIADIATTGKTRPDFPGMRPAMRTGSQAGA